VLITSGPTVEPIDDVRFLSNRSSGKMGAALANAALLMGAEVTVVAGPSKAPYPRGAKVISVETAEQMLKAASEELDRMDIVVAAAAVADYRPANPVKGKLRRSDEKIALELVPNPDVIATLANQAKPGTCLVGFAAEPSADVEEAKAKMKRKGLNAIAHNDVSNAQIGFESNQNQITLIDDQGNQHTSPIASKLQVALWLLERL
jgi:phosphopantothenoylcysteine decarboxylase/phosphopantothenate--cysteine ligase